MPHNFKNYRVVSRLKKTLLKVANLLENELNDLCEEENSKPKRIWMKDRTERQLDVETQYGLPNKIAIKYWNESKSCLCLRPKEFVTLLNMISPRLQRVDTLMRASLTPRLKLEVTLNFLTTGNNFNKLSEMYRVSKTSISFLVPEVCSAICESLQDYIKTPCTEQEWLEVSHGFKTQWNFPKCCGALYRNHLETKGGKGTTTLTALVDCNYCFMYIDSIYNKIVSNSTIFQNSLLYKPLENGLIPPEYYVIGNESFPLKQYIMRPYDTQPLSYQEKIFNYRLGRATRVAENAFGILASNFRIFDKPILCKPSTVDKLVMATCSLHNWLMKTEKSVYFPLGKLDIEQKDTGNIIPGKWRSLGVRLINIPCTNDDCKLGEFAINMRDNLKDYFLSDEGAVPWQGALVELAMQDE